MPREKIRASVVVPAYNRPELLERAILALSRQSVPQNSYEIIVVCGKSAGAMRACRHGLASVKNLSCLAVGSESPAAKRNTGIRAAKGSVVAFTDDDCVPDRQWLAEILRAFASNPHTAGVEGLTYTEGETALYHNAPVNLEGGLFPTCNIAYTKELLDGLGGFDESYHFYREDSDLAFRAVSHGNIVFSGKAKVLHPQRRVPLTRPLETLALLKEDVRLMKKMPNEYRRYLGTQLNAEFLKAGTSYVTLASLAIGGILHPAAFLAVPAAYIAVAWARLSAVRKTHTEFFAFTAFLFLRGIAFPFFFAYYWATIRRY
ncbi:MAG: glycosyltransferase family 2 protein [Candidatus Diapherotrites archaeon]|uniref:Glycosyltransferase family 2 protein n=1 Tax=Candidatus Iainarchaeum sp. TaxID=3101447 RepID=A0A8T3YMX8_9ARCH|nr:glycosyltransferase family 2 protein [Candidatus Diapherotrites archaeon]